VDNYLGPETSPGCKHAESQRGKNKSEIRNQIAEGKRQKEVNKDLQDAINSFIIH
jgi:hypothetical protein